MVAANARTAICFALSPGNEHDAPAGRALLEGLGEMPKGPPLLMDRAYEGDEVRELVLDFGIIPGCHPSPIALHLGNTIGRYKKRNEIKRLFRRLKGSRRIFSRFERPDVVFRAFLNFALIVEALCHQSSESVVF